MPHLFKLFIRLLPQLFWLLIFLTTILMLIELEPQPAGNIYADKIQHAFIFILLTISGFLAYNHKKRHVLGGVIMFGVVIELSQGVYTLTRQASFADWMADVVGVIFAVSLIELTKKMMKRIIPVK